jgi:hypothetical protein
VEMGASFEMLGQQFAENGLLGEIFGADDDGVAAWGAAGDG